MSGNGGRSQAHVRWPAMRALVEGAPVSVETLADISGRSPKSIRDRMKREGWLPQHIPSAPELGQRITRLTGNLIRELEAIEEAAVDGRYDKGRVESVTGMMRLVEKLAEINDAREVRQQEEQKTDAEIADILRIIDARIVELAGQFARELAGGGEGAAVGAGA